MEQTDILFKNKLIETFRAFIEFCNAHSIKYYTCGGTLIGAVRHHGLIPWDDDIDVWMLPDDYNKFCSLKGQVDGHYDIMDSRDDNYWLLSLAKFVDTNTTLWETEHFPCVTGVYVDVFPLYECNKEEGLTLKREYDKTSYSLTYAMAQHPFSQLLKLLLKGNIRLCIQYTIEKYYYKPNLKKFKTAYLTCVDKTKKAKGDMYISYDGMYGEKEIFPKKWFAETIIVPFEDFEIHIPKEYHKLLTQLYGDYMQLPPEEKRVSHHSHYFLDLNRRWTIDEIKQYKKYNR